MRRRLYAHKRCGDPKESELGSFPDHSIATSIKLGLGGAHNLSIELVGGRAEPQCQVTSVDN